MSRQAIKAINWAALAERLPETEKAAYAAFKSKSDKYLQRMMANPEAPPKIDWSYYQKTIVSPGLVDKFQKEYESLSIPYPTDKYTANIDAQKVEMAKKIESFIQEVNAEIENLNVSVDELKNMIPFAEMTMEDYRDAYPEGFLRTDKVTTWPHTEDSQEDLNEELSEDKNGH